MLSARVLSARRGRKILRKGLSNLSVSIGCARSSALAKVELMCVPSCPGNSVRFS